MQVKVRRSTTAVGQSDRKISGGFACIATTVPLHVFSCAGFFHPPASTNVELRTSNSERLVFVHGFAFFIKEKFFWFWLKSMLRGLRFSLNPRLLYDFGPRTLASQAEATDKLVTAAPSPRHICNRHHLARSVSTTEEGNKKCPIKQGLHV